MEKVLENTYRKYLLPDLWRIFIFATVSVCFGLLVNQFRDKPLSFIYSSKEERIQQDVRKILNSKITNAPEVNTSSQLLTLSEFQVFIEKKKGIVLDARPEVFYQFGHVPGALSLSRDNFEKAYQSVRSALEANKSQPIVVYCASQSCEDSQLVRKGLLNLGYTNISLFEGGWEEWKRAGLTQEEKP